MTELRDKKGLTEAEAIAKFKASNYTKPSLTADAVIFARSQTGIRLLMIRRGGHPYLGCWALPGGFADEGETIDQTAARELEEETGIAGIAGKLVGIYSKPGRDPRGWTVSAAYVTVVEAGELNASAGDDAAEVRWFPLTKNENGTIAAAIPEGDSIAFDHAEIIADAARTAGIIL